MNYCIVLKTRERNLMRLTAFKYGTTEITESVDFLAGIGFRILYEN